MPALDLPCSTSQCLVWCRSALFYADRTGLYPSSSEPAGVVVLDTNNLHAAPFSVPGSAGALTVSCDPNGDMLIVGKSGALLAYTVDSTGNATLYASSNDAVSGSRPTGLSLSDLQNLQPLTNASAATQANTILLALTTASLSTWRVFYVTTNASYLANPGTTPRAVVYSLVNLTTVVPYASAPDRTSVSTISLVGQALTNRSLPVAVTYLQTLNSTASDNSDTVFLYWHVVTPTGSPLPGGTATYVRVPLPAAPAQPDLLVTGAVSLFHGTGSTYLTRPDRVRRVSFVSNSVPSSGVVGVRLVAEASTSVAQGTTGQPFVPVAPLLWHCVLDFGAAIHPALQCQTKLPVVAASSERVPPLPYSTSNLFTVPVPVVDPVCAARNSSGNCTGYAAVAINVRADSSQSAPWIFVTLWSLPSVSHPWYPDEPNAFFGALRLSGSGYSLAEHQLGDSSWVTGQPFTLHSYDSYSDLLTIPNIGLPIQATLAAGGTDLYLSTATSLYRYRLVRRSPDVVATIDGGLPLTDGQHAYDRSGGHVVVLSGISPDVSAVRVSLSDMRINGTDPGRSYTASLTPSATGASSFTATFQLGASPWPQTKWVFQEEYAATQVVSALGMVETTWAKDSWARSVAPSAWHRTILTILTTASPFSSSSFVRGGDGGGGGGGQEVLRSRHRRSRKLLSSTDSLGILIDAPQHVATAPVADRSTMPAAGTEPLQPTFTALSPDGDLLVYLTANFTVVLFLPQQMATQANRSWARQAVPLPVACVPLYVTSMAVDWELLEVHLVCSPPGAVPSWWALRVGDPTRANVPWGAADNWLHLAAATLPVAVDGSSPTQRVQVVAHPGYRWLSFWFGRDPYRYSVGFRTPAHINSFTPLFGTRGNATDLFAANSPADGMVWWVVNDTTFLLSAAPTGTEQAQGAIQLDDDVVVQGAGSDAPTAWVAPPLFVRIEPSRYARYAPSALSITAEGQVPVVTGGLRNNGTLNGGRLPRQRLQPERLTVEGNDTLAGSGQPASSAALEDSEVEAGLDVVFVPGAILVCVVPTDVASGAPPPPLTPDSGLGWSARHRGPCQVTYLTYGTAERVIWAKYVETTRFTLRMYHVMALTRDAATHEVRLYTFDVDLETLRLRIVDGEPLTLAGSDAVPDAHYASRTFYSYRQYRLYTVGYYWDFQDPFLGAPFRVDGAVSGQFDDVAVFGARDGSTVIPTRLGRAVYVVRDDGTYSLFAMPEVTAFGTTLAWPYSPTGGYGAAGNQTTVARYSSLSAAGLVATPLILPGMATSSSGVDLWVWDWVSNPANSSEQWLNLNVPPDTVAFPDTGMARLDAVDAQTVRVLLYDSMLSTAPATAGDTSSQRGWFVRLPFVDSATLQAYPAALGRSPVFQLLYGGVCSSSFFQATTSDSTPDPTALAYAVAPWVLPCASSTYPPPPLPGALYAKAQSLVCGPSDNVHCAVDVVTGTKYSAARALASDPARVQTAFPFPFRYAPAEAAGLPSVHPYIRLCRGVEMLFACLADERACLAVDVVNSTQSTGAVFAISCDYDFWRTHSASATALYTPEDWLALQANNTVAWLLPLHTGVLPSGTATPYLGGSVGTSSSALRALVTSTPAPYRGAFLVRNDSCLANELPCPGAIGCYVQVFRSQVTGVDVVRRVRAAGGCALSSTNGNGTSLFAAQPVSVTQARQFCGPCWSATYARNLPQASLWTDYGAPLAVDTSTCDCTMCRPGVNDSRPCATTGTVACSLDPSSFAYAPLLCGPAATSCVATCFTTPGSSVISCAAVAGTCACQIYNPLYSPGGNGVQACLPLPSTCSVSELRAWCGPYAATCSWTYTFAGGRTSTSGTVDPATNRLYSCTGLPNAPLDAATGLYDLPPPVLAASINASAWVPHTMPADAVLPSWVDENPILRPLPHVRCDWDATYLRSRARLFPSINSTTGAAASAQNVLLATSNLESLTGALIPSEPTGETGGVGPFAGYEALYGIPQFCPLNGTQIDGTRTTGGLMVVSATAAFYTWNGRAYPYLSASGVYMDPDAVSFPYTSASKPMAWYLPLNYRPHDTDSVRLYVHNLVPGMPYALNIEWSTMLVHNLGALLQPDWNGPVAVLYRTIVGDPVANDTVLRIDDAISLRLSIQQSADSTQGGEVVGGPFYLRTPQWRPLPTDLWQTRLNTPQTASFGPIPSFTALSSDATIEVSVSVPSTTLTSAGRVAITAATNACKSLWASLSVANPLGTPRCDALARTANLAGFVSSYATSLVSHLQAAAVNVDKRSPLTLVPPGGDDDTWWKTLSIAAQETAHAEFLQEVDHVEVIHARQPPTVTFYAAYTLLLTFQTLGLVPLAPQTPGAGDLVGQTVGNSSNVSSTATGGGGLPNALHTWNLPGLQTRLDFADGLRDRRTGLVVVEPATFSYPYLTDDQRLTVLSGPYIQENGPGWMAQEVPFPAITGNLYSAGFNTTAGTASTCGGQRSASASASFACFVSTVDFANFGWLSLTSALTMAKVRARTTITPHERIHSAVICLDKVAVVGWNGSHGTRWGWRRGVHLFGGECTGHRNRGRQHKDVLLHLRGTFEKDVTSKQSFSLWC